MNVQAQRLKKTVLGSSVVIEIGAMRVRALVDTGAEVSIIHNKFLSQITSKKPVITQNSPILRAANNELLPRLGTIKLDFKIGNNKIKLPFQVASGISHSIILSMNFIQGQQIILNYKEQELLWKGETAPFEDNQYMESLVRVSRACRIPPYTAVKCYGKSRAQRRLPKAGMCEITAINTGFIAQEPGLMVANAVARVGKRGWFPMIVCNETGKHFTLKRGNVIGRIEAIKSEEMQTVDTGTEPALAGFNAIRKTVDNELNAPDEYKRALEELTNEFRDIFAESDMEMGQTQAMKASIDTGDKAPIRLRPYRTVLNYRNIVDDAIDSML